MVAIVFAGAVVISRLFYDSYLGMLVLLIPAGFVCSDFKKTLEKKKRLRAQVELKELLEAVSANLCAGLSLENSYIRGVENVALLYDKKSLLAWPLQEGINKLSLHIPVEQMFLEFAETTDLEDARRFAALAAVAKKNGGNLIQIISQATGHISDKIKTDQEIATMMAAKRMEQNIMCVMPFAMIVYMKFTNSGYFDILYHNAFGILFMTSCLMVIFAAYIMGRWIVAISMQI